MPVNSYAVTDEEAEKNALEYSLKLQGINTSYHRELWTEMKNLRKERDNSNFKGEKNLVKYLIQKYNLDPINKPDHQCELMERIVGYFTGPSGLSSSTHRVCYQDGKWCFQTYYLDSNYDGGYDDHAPDFIFISDIFGRYIGVWSSFGKSFSKTKGYFKIIQHGDKPDPYLKDVVIPEANNTMSYISYLGDKLSQSNISYFRIDNCYIKEIHLKLNSIYIDPSYLKKSKTKN